MGIHISSSSRTVSLSGSGRIASYYGGIIASSGRNKVTMADTSAIYTATGPGIRFGSTAGGSSVTMTKRCD